MATKPMSKWEFLELKERYLCGREPTLDEQLQLLLAKYRSRRCKECGQRIGWGDIAWNNGCTEAGTGYCTVQIQCVSCSHEVVHIDSWYPFIDDRDDLLHVLDKYWGEYI